MMSRFTRSVAKLLTAQLHAGAQAVQIFDSWVGCLGVEDYRRFVLPHNQALVNALPADAPVIYFFTGNPALIFAARAVAANRKNFAISLDWRIPLGAAREMIGSEVPLQGNLDPAVLLCSPAVIRAEATRILNQLKGQPGHIFNLGHGVLPSTPPENAKLLVDLVKNNGQ
jgi:uroporphyrinogen decarboxylase